LIIINRVKLDSIFRRNHNFNVKTVVLLFILAVNLSTFGQSIYTNDMDYVLGDCKQRFITGAVATQEQADNLLKGFKAMKVNGIRIPIFPRDANTGVSLNPHPTIMKYFYEQALVAGFHVFANPAQGGGGIRIANHSLSNTSSVKGIQAATDELVNRIIEFSNEYPGLKWLNPFNEDGRTNTVWSISQINEIYKRLYDHGVNGAELIGPCTWGLPAGIDMLKNTDITKYITVASSHNLGHNDGQWSTFKALAEAKNLPVWDSEANNDPGNTDTNKVEAALENKVDGLVVYNSGNNIDLNTGAINGTNVYYMSVYLKQRESIAVNGTATQSETTAPQWYVEASRAIDGNVNGHWSGGNGSVTHTAGVNPWWQVDLGSNKNIEEIKIYNRTDANPQNLSNFTVTVTNTSGRTVFSKTYADYPNPFLVIETGDISGRIVKVQKNDIGTLTLAEVLIFATSQPLSINIYDEIKVSVFPNPTTDKLIISIPNNVLKRYTLYNLSGQMISTNNTNTKEVEINVSKLSMGIYFLKMEGDKFYGIHKIIKK
jgi:hypothetical protein